MSVNHQSPFARNKTYAVLPHGIKNVGVFQDEGIPLFAFRTISSDVAEILNAKKGNRKVCFAIKITLSEIITMSMCDHPQ